METYRAQGSRLRGSSHARAALRRRGHRVARPGPARSASVSPSPPSASTGSPTGPGCCAATARWPRARSGKPSAQAAFDNLDNLSAIIDVNRLGQTGPTRYDWDLDIYADRFKAFGWHAIEIDGHDVDGGRRAPTPRRIATKGKPTVIVAQHDQGQGRRRGRRTRTACTASPSTRRRTPSASWAG